MLTREDVKRTLEDERHLGHGLAVCQELSERQYCTVLNQVAKQANRLGLDYEGLFAWSNSKYGRWLYDEIAGRDVPPTKAVPNLLNAEALASLAQEGEPALQHFNTRVVQQWG